MPRKMFRSRTFRRVYVRTPTKTVINYEKRKPAKAKCANCGTVLAGVASERPYKMKNMPKTKKRPERPFGGVLCSKCTRLEIIKRNRK